MSPSLTCWVLLAALTLVTAVYVKFLNARHAQRRERAGKVGVVQDISLEDDVRAYEIQRELREKAGAGRAGLNVQAFDDLTDTQNEDFIFAL